MQVILCRQLCCPEAGYSLSSSPFAFQSPPPAFEVLLMCLSNKKAEKNPGFFGLKHGN